MNNGLEINQYRITRSTYGHLFYVEHSEDGVNWVEEVSGTFPKEQYAKEFIAQLEMKEGK